MSLRRGTPKGYLLDSNGKVDPFAVSNYELIGRNKSFTLQDFSFIVLFLAFILGICYLIYIATGWIGLIVAIVIAVWLVFRI
jgi:fatty-acid desaturase